VIANGRHVYLDVLFEPSFPVGYDLNSVDAATQRNTHRTAMKLVQNRGLMAVHPDNYCLPTSCRQSAAQPGVTRYYDEHC
jgi:hypothetical protein